ncbi:MerR family transcriptional regulator [uncultured Clostridium sp.]|uniref:helix-turn-helix domain-containing protein n=1 Tax=uncultured Clostridium sp. TaxID=59620 RepID=UPI0025FED7E5|nr:MerR family transcriptional regulator [uncultured Clostridium sp.]
MKIGEFSTRGEISKDTIRYYVEEGLLIPDITDGHMSFSQRDLNDLDYIKKCKTLGFNIREIKFMMAITRTSHLTEKDAVHDYYDMLEKKKASLYEQIDSLNTSIRLIDENIHNLDQQICLEKKRLGVPLKALSLLACPECGGSLSLNQAQLTSKYVYEGILQCDCGYQVKIHDGVVLTGNHYQGEYDHPDFSYGGHYDNVSRNFVTYLQKSYDYVCSRLKNEDLKDKVVLETNLDGYVFLYRNFPHLKNDCIYVMIDKFEETINLFKQRTERLGLELDILFIADASVQYPLKKGCIDYFIDFFGEDEFLLYHPRTLIEMADSYFSPSLCAFGAYMSYDANSKSIARVPLCYPECSPDAFSGYAVREGYGKVGFSFEETETGIMTETYQKYRYQCHVNGDALHMHCFTAKRNNT